VRSRLRTEGRQVRRWALWVFLSSIGMFGAAAASVVTAFVFGDPLPTYPDGFPHQAARDAAEFADLLLGVAGYLGLGALATLVLGLALVFTSRAR
jgi:hypothetical protein